MNNNQLANVEKTTAYTKLVFDNECTLRVGKADTRVDIIDGVEVIFIYPSIREKEYRVRYDSTTLDKHGTTTAEELLSYWELNGFFLTNSSIVADSRVEFRADLPTTIGSPVIGALYLVEKPTTILLGVYTTYQSGLYIKDNDTGSLNDWRRLNVKVKFTDGEYFVVNSTDQSKQLRFDISGFSSGETRIAIWPDKDITVADNQDLINESLDRQTGDEGPVTIHSDVTNSGSGQIITDQERVDINASIGVHSDVNLIGVNLFDNTTLKYNGTSFIPCLHRYVRSSVLSINNTNVLQDKINESIDVQRISIHKLTISYQWSLNDGSQDFISVASFGGQRIQDVITPNELHRQEPKDTQGTDTDGRGTNQIHAFYKSYFITPQSAGPNDLILQFAGSANGDLASMWEACIEVEELISITGN